MMRPLADLRDPLVAIALLTRLPVPAIDWNWAGSRGAAAAWAYPLVGVIVGAIAALVFWAATLFGVPKLVSAGLAVLATVLTTGALHEDGLADTADGFWGGHDSERRLEIMNDSRIGAYGVIALVLFLGLRWQAIGSLSVHTIPALIGAAVLSRAAMLVVMGSLDHARPTGLAAATGRPSSRTLVLGIGLAIAICLPLLAVVTVPAVIVAAVAVWLMVRLAQAKIGGQTGDVLGATQQVAEVAILVCLSAL